MQTEWPARLRIVNIPGMLGQSGALAHSRPSHQDYRDIFLYRAVTVPVNRVTANRSCVEIACIIVVSVSLKPMVRKHQLRTHSRVHMQLLIKLVLHGRGIQSLLSSARLHLSLDPAPQTDNSNLQPQTLT